VQGPLVLVQHVVHLPELPLGAGCLSCFCRMLRVWVRGAERKVAEDKAQPVTQAALRGLDDRGGHAAIWALVIAVVHQAEWRVRKPLGMVALAYREGQVGARLDHHDSCSFFWSASNALRIPSAPGLTPVGET